MQGLIKLLDGGILSSESPEEEEDLKNIQKIAEKIGAGEFPDVPEIGSDGHDILGLWESMYDDEISQQVALIRKYIDDPEGYRVERKKF